MQGLVLQLTRAGFLLMLWLFIWSVLRILRNDIYAPTGAVMVRRGLALRGVPMRRTSPLTVLISTSLAAISVRTSPLTVLTRCAPSMPVPMKPSGEPTCPHRNRDKVTTGSVRYLGLNASTFSIPLALMAFRCR